MKKRILFILSLAILPAVTCFAAGNGNKDAQAASVRSSSENADALDLSAMHTLDLQTAVNMALHDNPGIQAARQRVLQAKARVDQARATYWPRLDASTSGSRVKLSGNTYDENLTTARYFNPNATIDNPEMYYGAGLTATWTLFDGFERKFTNLAARYKESADKQGLMDAQRLLIYAVAQSFFSAQLALENIAIKKADETFNQRQLQEAQSRYRVGTGSLSDVLNFQVRENEAKTGRINQEYEYDTALFSLAALLGLAQARFPGHVNLARLAPETESELSTPAVEQLITKALDLRPDIQETRLAVKQAKARIQTAQADYYPSVVVAGNVEGERSDDIHFEHDDFGNSIQVSLSCNLFSGGATRAKVREANHRKQELKKQLEEMILSASAEIRDSAALVSTAQTQVALQRQNVDLVKRTRDLVEKEYNAGQGTLVRLNEAQKDLTAARGSLALSLVALRQAWVQLQTRTGTILATYGVP